MVAYNYKTMDAKIEFMVERSRNNDRRRSRLSQRKSYGNELVMVSKSKENNAKNFGQTWAIDFNDGLN